MENEKIYFEDELKKSPVFNMSLSDKELFHSNFLKWLAVTYPSNFLNMLKELVGEKKLEILKGFDKENETFEVLREYKNFDFCITHNGLPVLILENKVKSIATSSQLKEYEDKVKILYGEKTPPENICYIILSLSPISDEIVGWKKINYDSLSKRIEKCFKSISNDYHRQLIEDYSRFIFTLSTIINSDTCENYNLEELKINDIKEKIKYSKLLEELNNVLLSNGYNVLSISASDIKHLMYKDEKWKNRGAIMNKLEEFKDDKKPLLMTNFNYTNSGGGLIEVNFKLRNTQSHEDNDDDFFCLIQFQKNNYRVGIVFKDKVKNTEDFKNKFIKESTICNFLNNNNLWPGNIKINGTLIKDINQFNPFFFEKIEFNEDVIKQIFIDRILKELERYKDENCGINICTAEYYLSSNKENQ